MILKDLLSRLKEIERVHPEALESTLVIATVRPGIPSRHTSPVRECMLGFDWDRGKFIFYPSEHLVPVKTYLGTVREAAEARLKELEEAFMKTGFEYGVIGKNRRDWVEGCIEGIKMQLTEIEDNNANPRQTEKAETAGSKSGG